MSDETCKTCGATLAFCDSDRYPSGSYVCAGVYLRQLADARRLLERWYHGRPPLPTERHVTDDTAAFLAVSPPAPGSGGPRYCRNCSFAEHVHPTPPEIGCPGFEPLVVAPEASMSPAAEKPTAKSATAVDSSPAPPEPREVVQHSTDGVTWMTCPGDRVGIHHCEAFQYTRSVRREPREATKESSPATDAKKGSGEA